MSCSLHPAAMFVVGLLLGCRSGGTPDAPHTPSAEGGAAGASSAVGTWITDSGDSANGGSDARAAGRGGAAHGADSGASSDGGTGDSAAPADAGTEDSGSEDPMPVLPPRADVIGAMKRANGYFTAKWPDPGTDTWTGGVYYEGLMGLYEVDPDPSYYDYAVRWAESHQWQLRSGPTTRNADDQCAGQTYLDLYRIDPQPARIAEVQSSIDAMVASPGTADWTWVDALQMAMPVFAKLGALRSDSAYYEKAYAMYSHTKNVQGGSGLYSPSDHLWWRDRSFAPPYVEPNGEDCYWSRGNGWVYAALVRTLDVLPEDETHRAEYLADFRAMSEALAAVQRRDGFWNVSLHDPSHFAGEEVSGTALFTYGMAWGVRKGFLEPASYGPRVARAWNAMVSEALRPDGSLGFVQGTGKQPSSRQPVSYESVPNAEDFGLGCFLLAGSESAKLASP